MNDHSPPVSREDKIALVKLLLEISDLIPIICLAKCDYHEDSMRLGSICLNPDTYERYGRSIIDSTVLNCPFFRRKQAIQVIDNAR